MLAINSIEFMMFIGIPGVLVLGIIYSIWVDNSNSDYAVKARELQELNRYTEDEDDEDDRNYELDREQLQYFRNETFDRQQGKNR